NSWFASVIPVPVTVEPLYEVDQPALVVHGTADAVWPPAGGAALAADLPRGRHVPVEGAGHLVGVERSRTVNDLLTGFLEEHTDTALD
ncbi:alpha/beta hydrolase, partial [Halobacteriales archaeon QS_5_70_15]